MREKPDRICWPDHREEEWGSDVKGRRLSVEASGEETGEDAASHMLPKTIREELPKPHRKISRLRTISHQIRFLRRLEQSLKRRERLVSQSDSYGEDDDGCEGSPPLLSPLLPHQSTLHEMPKNSTFGHLRQPPHLVGSRSLSRHRAGSKQKRTGELLIPYEEQQHWQAVKVAGNDEQTDQ